MFFILDSLAYSLIDSELAILGTRVDVERAINLMSYASLAGVLQQKDTTNDVTIRLIRGLASCLSRKYQEAEDYLFTEEFDLSPQERTLFKLAVGVNYAISGRIEFAERQLRSAVQELLSDDVPLDQTAVEFLLGYARISYCRTAFIHGTSSTAASAIDAMRERLKHRPQLAPLQANRFQQVLAAQLSYGGAHEQAASILKGLCDYLFSAESPNLMYQVECLIDLAISYLNSNEFINARETVSRAIEIESGSGNDILRLARAHALSGLLEFKDARPNAALFHFENANSLYLEFPSNHISERLYFLRIMEELAGSFRRMYALRRIKEQIGSLTALQSERS